MNRDGLVKEIIEVNKKAIINVSVGSTDKEILEFLFIEICKENEHNRYLNVISFFQYASYLRKQKSKCELLNEYVEKILGIK